MGSGGEIDARLEGQEFGKPFDEERVRMDTRDVAQKRSHGRQAPGERRIKSRKLSERDKTLYSAPGHRGDHGAHDERAAGSGAGFGDAAAPQKVQVLVPQPRAEKAMSGLEPAAGLEPAQLRRVVGRGEHEVVVPRATLALRRASTPALILERVCRDDVHHRKRAEKQNGGQPRAERDEHGHEAHEHHRPLKHVHEGTAQLGRAIAGLLARPMQTIEEFRRFVEGKIEAHGLRVNAIGDVLLEHFLVQRALPFDGSRQCLREQHQRRTRSCPHGQRDERAPLAGGVCGRHQAVDHTAGHIDQRHRTQAARDNKSRQRDERTVARASQQPDSAPQEGDVRLNASGDLSSEWHRIGSRKGYARGAVSGTKPSPRPASLDSSWSVSTHACASIRPRWRRVPSLSVAFTPLRRRSVDVTSARGRHDAVTTPDRAAASTMRCVVAAYAVLSRTDCGERLPANRLSHACVRRQPNMKRLARTRGSSISACQSNDRSSRDRATNRRMVVTSRSGPAPRRQAVPAGGSGPSEAGQARHPTGL